MAYNERLVPLLQELVRIPSYVDANHDESALVKYISTKLVQNPNLVVDSQPVKGNRQNLIVHDRSALPSTVLFGHMDTVNPKESSVEPFAAKLIDGKVYGLGAVDMKSGLSIMIDTALHAHRQDVGYVFSVDEEYDFLGAKRLQRYKKIQPDTIINIEPTSNIIYNGCRGITEFKFEIQGKSAHAGRKMYGVNAIEKAVEVGFELQKEVTKYDDSGLKSSVNTAELHGGLLKRTTKNGRLVFSHSGNTVPNFARINCEIRLGSPLLTEEKIQTVLGEIAGRIGVQIDNIKFRFHLGSLFTPVEKLGDFEKALRDCDQPVKYGDINLAGYYEVQMLQKAWESRTIIYGAGPNEKSHAEDEYVDIDSLYQADRVIKHFLRSTI